MLYELKRIRKASGLTQSDAASVFNVPLNTWRGWEQCKHLPKDSMLIKRIADYFHVSIEMLYGYDSPELYELEKLRKQSGRTVEEMAELAGVSVDMYRSWEECTDAPKNEAVIKRIASFIGVSVEALYGYDLVSPGALTTEEDYDKNSFIYRPVHFEVAAGTPILMQETSLELPAPSEVLRKHPKSVFVRVDGDSMDNVLPDGCYALVDTDSTEVPDGTACCVTVNGYSATIKRVHHISNGYMLAPDSSNPEHKPIIYNYDEDGTDEVRILGEVVWYMVPFDWEI